VALPRISSEVAQEDPLPKSPAHLSTNPTGSSEPTEGTAACPPWCGLYRISDISEALLVEEYRNLHMSTRFILRHHFNTHKKNIIKISKICIYKTFETYQSCPNVHRGEVPTPDPSGNQCHRRSSHQWHKPVDPMS